MKNLRVIALKIGGGEVDKWSERKIKDWSKRSSWWVERRVRKIDFWSSEAGKAVNSMWSFGKWS